MKAKYTWLLQFWTIWKMNIFYHMSSLSWKLQHVFFITFSLDTSTRTSKENFIHGRIKYFLEKQMEQQSKNNHFSTIFKREHLRALLHLTLIFFRYFSRDNCWFFSFQNYFEFYNLPSEKWTFFIQRSHIYSKLFWIIS